MAKVQIPVDAEGDARFDRVFEREGTTITLPPRPSCRRRAGRAKLLRGRDLGMTLSGSRGSAGASPSRSIRSRILRRVTALDGAPRLRSSTRKSVFERDKLRRCREAFPECHWGSSRRGEWLKSRQCAGEFDSHVSDRPA